jgi:hypothetical protein
VTSRSDRVLIEVSVESVAPCRSLTQVQGSPPAVASASALGVCSDHDVTLPKVAIPVKYCIQSAERTRDTYLLYMQHRKQIGFHESLHCQSYI